MKKKYALKPKQKQGHKTKQNNNSKEIPNRFNDMHLNRAQRETQASSLES